VPFTTLKTLTLYCRSWITNKNWIYPFIWLIMKKWEHTFFILLYSNKRKISVYCQDETGKLYKANQFRLDCLGLFSFDQRCTNSGRQFARANKFCMVTPDIYGSSPRNLRHVTLFALLILMRFLDLWKTCAPLRWDFSASPRPKLLSFPHQLNQKCLSCYFCLDPNSKYAHLHWHFI